MTSKFINKSTQKILIFANKASYPRGLMNIISHVEAFLLKRSLNIDSPLLLALSGGPDSLCLFYALLEFRKKHGVLFHVAHIDHGWRSESRSEASQLEVLAAKHEVPFHLHELNPSLLKGNLEAVCREERYNHFAALSHTFHFQALLTGHHQDDQAETVFKRLLEGAHWSRWAALEPDCLMKGLRLLRPLLTVKKKEILESLLYSDFSPFEDSTNKDRRFLRARQREEIFPWLNREFGKEVQTSLSVIGEEAKELTEFFDTRLSPLLKHAIEGPWGICLDLEDKLPESLLELKYLLRLLCRQSGFFLSKEIVNQAAEALHFGKANLHFSMGSHQLWIDRKRIFVLESNNNVNKGRDNTLKPSMLDISEIISSETLKNQSFNECKQNRWLRKGWKKKRETTRALQNASRTNICLSRSVMCCARSVLECASPLALFLAPASQPMVLFTHSFADWELEVSQVIYDRFCKQTTWKEGWLGVLECFLPLDSKRNKNKNICLSTIKKKWSQAKVPAFLTSYFPLITQNNSIYHEFLTGRALNDLTEGETCWRIKIKKIARRG